MADEQRRRALRITALLAGDAAVTATTVVVPGILGGGTPEMPLPWLPFLLVLIITGQLAAGTYGPIRHAWSPERVTLGVLLAAIALSTAALAEPALAPGWRQTVLFAFLLTSGLVAARWALTRLVVALYRAGIGVKNALVAGEPGDARSLIERLQTERTEALRVVGHVTTGVAADSAALGTMGDLSAILEEHDVQSVIVSAGTDPAALRRLMTEAFGHGATVSVVPVGGAEIPAGLASRTGLNWPMVEMRVPRLHLLQIASKRALDLLGAIVGLALLSPIMAATALAVCLEGRPILFRQKRLGVGGRPFTIYKFRSMRPDAEKVLRDNDLLYRKYVDNNYKLPPDEDPRISNVGRFIRRASLDELPQLFNVLLGDMSLVGPRPVVPDEIREYGQAAPAFLAVVPGLTGWWQVSGRSRVMYPDRARLDIAYVRNWSLMFDLKILLLTFPRLFNGAQ